MADHNPKHTDHSHENHHGDDHRRHEDGGHTRQESSGIRGKGNFVVAGLTSGHGVFLSLIHI